MVIMGWGPQSEGRDTCRTGVGCRGKIFFFEPAARLASHGHSLYVMVRKSDTWIG